MDQTRCKSTIDAAIIAKKYEPNWPLVKGKLDNPKPLVNKCSRMPLNTDGGNGNFCQDIDPLDITLRNYVMLDGTIKKKLIIPNKAARSA